MKTQVLAHSNAEGAELTTAESKTLAECEAVLSRNLHSFMEVGHALATIRDGGLYRVTHGTFEAYVKEKFEMGARRAQQIMQSSMIVRRIADAKSISHLPETEGQARKLASVREDKLVEVWAEIVKEAESKGVKITSQLVRFHAIGRRNDPVRPSRRKKQRRVGTVLFHWDQNTPAPRGRNDEETKQINGVMRLFKKLTPFAQRALADFMVKITDENEKREVDRAKRNLK